MSPVPNIEKLNGTSQNLTASSSQPSQNNYWMTFPGSFGAGEETWSDLSSSFTIPHAHDTPRLYSLNPHALRSPCPTVRKLDRQISNPRTIYARQQENRNLRIVRSCRSGSCCGSGKTKGTHCCNNNNQVLTANIDVRQPYWQRHQNHHTK